MKKTLFLSAILGAALCSSAFGVDQTFTGSSSGNMNVATSVGTDTITFQLDPNAGTGMGQGNWFASAQTTAAKILIQDDAETEGVVEGLNISNGNTGTYVTFSGAVSGNGSISKIGNGSHLAFNFTGNVTEYTGNITLSAGAAFYLVFGSEIRTDRNGITSYGTAAATQASTTTAGVSGTGDITFTTGNNTVIYNYASSAGTVYITNAIKRTNNASSKVQFRGGASYILTANADIKQLTLTDSAHVKYTGTNLMSVNGGSIAAGSVLEGVRSGSGAGETANISYQAQYGMDSGTLKNVQIENIAASNNGGSITLDSVVGWFGQNSTQGTLTLTGSGVALTKGYSGSTTTIQKLIGSGNIESRYTGTDTIIIQDATEWTGSFISTAGTANVTFNGNSNADVFAKSAMNVTLKGTNYSDMHIKAYNGNTATVTVQNSTSDVTIEQLINDPSDKTSNGTMNVIVNTAGHKVIVEEWATVNSITLKNGSSIKLNNHNVGTLTMESGSGTVTSGANIGSGQHGITNLAIGEDATLTLGNVATVTTVTGADGTLTVNKNLTVNGASTIGTLSVSGDSTIMLNNHNVGTLEVTGGSNFLFSNAAVGSANHTMSKVEVADDASLTFGTANTTVGAITLGNNSHLTVGNEGSHKFNLTTTGLTVNGNANINADLVVNGGTMTFANEAILTMGCTVSIGNDVTVVLTQEMVDSISHGDWVEIIANVEGIATLGHTSFTGAGFDLEQPTAYHLTQIGDKIYITPEPATATLSLLALAALAARRKRH